MSYTCSTYIHVYTVCCSVRGVEVTNNITLRTHGLKKKVVDSRVCRTHYNSENNKLAHTIFIDYADRWPNK